MELKKILVAILSCIVLFSFSCEGKNVGAVTDIKKASLIVKTGVKTISFLWGVVRNGTVVLLNRSEVSKMKKEIEKHKGFRTRAEITKLIKGIMEGSSDIKIYGQEKAKKQCKSALASCLENIYGNPSEKRGNVVYIIGESGVGKTAMARALACAFLKYHEKSSVFIDSSHINNEQSLGEQLFKTVTKSVNLKKEKNWRNLWGILNFEENIVGNCDIKVASRILEHIYSHYESVVILDEYDKMKLMCKPADAPEEYEDRTADEILKCIASRGEYYVGNNIIDCRKVLFFVTTNETKEQLYEKFGYKGSVGGGAQKLNVIEFDNLDKSCCRNIVGDMVSHVKENLTRQTGDYKLKSVCFSNETLEQMSEYILGNTVKQARAKFDLEQNIYALFCFELEQNIGKSFEIIYTSSGQAGKIGEFSKRERREECSDGSKEFSKILGVA